jgi:uncharacterized Zn finger protein
MIRTPTIITGDVPMDDILKYYHVATYCENCENQHTVAVLKGVLKKGLTFTCDECGCVVKLG